MLLTTSQAAREAAYHLAESQRGNRFSKMRKVHEGLAASYQQKIETGQTVPEQPKPKTGVDVIEDGGKWYVHDFDKRVHLAGPFDWPCDAIDASNEIQIQRLGL
jgi:hypothetical protein